MDSRNKIRIEKGSEAWYKSFARNSYNFQCKWIEKARTGSISDQEWGICADELWQLSQEYQQDEFTDTVLAAIYAEIERLNEARRVSQIACTEVFSPAI